MAKTSNQKGRILAVRDILHQETDENNRLTIPELMQKLAARGISVERKSLYDDIEALRQAGDDIQLERGKGGGYYMGERLFQLPELKLLVDAVQASRFVTARKSGELIKKLESLTSRDQARALQRQVTVSGRIKNMNESIYYLVDTIQTAIAQDRQLRFRYANWVLDKTAAGGFARQDRHGGAWYTVSPWALVWMEENYYLIAFDSASGSIRHYRVDKMHHQAVTEKAREGRQQFKNFDLPGYTKSLFGMFSGQVQDIQLELGEELVGVLVDRFGTGLTLQPGSREGWFTVRLQVVPGPTFYGWLLSFGTRARVLAPADLRAQLAQYAADVAALYR